MKRISMWSGPRNVSTALMYSFFHRGDCHVVDEPFYAYYLEQTGIEHPGRSQTLEQHESNPQQVVCSLTEHEYGKDILFMKNMPHHMLGMDLSFVHSFDNFFLIREPRAMIASYIKKIPEVTMSDLGLDQQYRLFKDLVEQGKEVPVVDSSDLLRSPEDMLSQLCRRLEIPFTARMLQWRAGPIEGDGAWAPYWYDSVHRSTGLAEPKEVGKTLIPDHLESLVQECERYYHELKKFELKA